MFVVRGSVCQSVGSEPVSYGTSQIQAAAYTQYFLSFYYFFYFVYDLPCAVYEVDNM